MSDPILTIGIPTYNGAKHIKETLDSIVAQIKGIEQEIEIVISDNASTDETPQIIKEYQSQYPIIRYFRNEENLGFDKNLDLLFRRAQGKYVWILGDDDVILSHGIKKVFNVIEEHPDVAAIFVNWSNYSCDLKRCNVERAVKLDNDLLCISANEFLSTVKLNPVLISSNVISRNHWQNCFRDSYLGSGWIHYEILLHLVADYKSYCIASPFVIYRSGDIRWDKQGEQSIVNNISLLRIIKSLPQNRYSKKIVKSLVKITFSSIPQTIIICKMKGLKLKQLHLGKMVVNYGFYLSFWMIDFPLLLIPKDLYTFVFKINKIRFINRINKKLIKVFAYVFTGT